MKSLSEMLPVMTPFTEDPPTKITLLGTGTPTHSLKWQSSGYLIVVADAFLGELRDNG
jgi:hypothetical protein